MEIKSCPFCGGKAYLEDLHSQTFVAVQCNDCNALGRASEFVNKAIDFWNTRHNSHDNMITAIANFLEINRHRLGNELQRMQYEAMVERGEIKNSN